MQFCAEILVLLNLKYGLESESTIPSPIKKNPMKWQDSGHEYCRVVMIMAINSLRVLIEQGGLQTANSICLKMLETLFLVDTERCLSFMSMMTMTPVGKWFIFSLYFFKSWLSSSL